ncbi:MAG: SDR family oxidoreductase [Dehalococcoidia bacterium]|nr:SDR family oxidoreductase [Dehalococcoidia bacterium]
MRLKNKIAVVTGAADGIGRATAVLLAREGADVVVGDIQAAAAEETARLVGAEGRRGMAVAGDVRDRAVLERLVDAATREMGGLDILVNNAGTLGAGHFLQYEMETFDRVMAVNARAQFELSQMAARWWVAQKRPGRIVNVASVNAEFAMKDVAAYAMSKAAVRMMTKALALELAPFGIIVNAVAPGTVRTGMNREMLGGTRLEQRWVERTPLGRVGEPEDIAKAIVFLASEDASYITGQTLFIEGGRTLYMH